MHPETPSAPTALSRRHDHPPPAPQQHLLAIRNLLYIYIAWLAYLTLPTSKILISLTVRPVPPTHARKPLGFSRHLRLVRLLPVRITHVITPCQDIRRNLQTHTFPHPSRIAALVSTAHADISRICDAKDSTRASAMYHSAHTPSMSPRQKPIRSCHDP